MHALTLGFATTLFCLAPCAVAQSSPSLWITDDTSRTIFEVTPAGQLLGMFDAGTDVSCVSVDPTTDTLWTTSEGSDRVLNITKTGAVVIQFPTSTFDSQANQTEGIDVDPVDGTLWVVDDDALRVYNLQRDGTLISSFPTSRYDAGAQSPQGIACDPDGSLWLTDNISDRIYNVAKSGQLLSSFSADAFDEQVGNPQGISVDPTDGGLWVTARDTSRAYNISRTGNLLSSFPTSSNPTGIAFDDHGGNEPLNRPPMVSAGVDQTIVFSETAILDGSVTDDNLPAPPSTVEVTWSLVSGSGQVTFGDPNAIDTTASFSMSGSYVLQLLADDGDLQTTDEVVVTVLPGTGDGWSIHVASITLRAPGQRGGEKQRRAIVRIANENGILVTGATVTGTFTGPFVETVSGRTNRQGRVVLDTTQTSRGNSSSFCIDSVTHPFLTYDQGANVETCDSR